MRQLHTFKSQPFTRASLTLTYVAIVCLSLGACQEEEMEYDNNDQSAEQSSPSSNNSNRDGSYQGNYDGGVAGTESFPEFEAAGETDDSQSSNMDEPSQTWQESEAAQRQPIVDVGGGNTLTLHSQRVITKVEGHRARTIVDQIFYSPYDRELEGTFRYSLPVGASVSHYALYLGRINGDFNALQEREANELPSPSAEGREVFELSTEGLVAHIGEDAEAWGELRVGRVVSQADGREAYEDTTRRRVDPALVENVDPNAFQARVFPIQARGYTRIVFAYDEALARVDDELVYTFPLPADELAHLSIHVLVDNDQDGQGEPQAEIESALPLSPLPAREMNDEDDQNLPEEETSAADQGIAWSGEAEGQGPGGALTLRLPVSDEVEIVTGRDGELQAFTGRVLLDGLSELTTQNSMNSERAIFVLDTSLSSQPTRFGINRALLAEILSQNSDLQEFAILSFDLGAEWLTEGFVPNTAAQRESALNRVDRILLEGATRFDAVADAIADAEWITEDVDLFLLSDGSINWGTQSPDQVALTLNRMNRVFAYRTGVGAENLSLYRTLTRRGGVFTCLTMESLPACATAHRSSNLRLVNVRVDGVGNQPAVTADIAYTHRDSDLFDGAELNFAGQLSLPGQASLRLTLSDGTQEHVLSYPIELPAADDEKLAPRAWAELLVSLMSESGQPRLQELIYALSQRYTILTKEVVLLVLESDEEYIEYHLPTVWESTLNGVESIVDLLEEVVNAGTLYTPMIEQVLTSVSPQIEEATGLSLDAHLSALELNLYELSLPVVTYDHEARSATDYYQDQVAPSDYGIYMDEAETLFAEGLNHAAARALSSIVENDPSNGVALRLVAYRLNTWGFTGLSAELFTEVLRRRPYEPQSYRDLAYVVRQEQPALAALLYEIALTGAWDDRFQQLNVLIGEEYSLFVRQLERANHPLADLLRRRATDHYLSSPTEDLRVIMSWNTDNVDIDLWVTSPDGFKCYYSAPQSPSGGVLLDDIVQGFGPERFSQPTTQQGSYSIQAHYYGNNGNRLEAETFVHVTVIKYAGTDQEETQEFDVLLNDAGEVANIATINF